MSEPLHPLRRLMAEFVRNDMDEAVRIVRSHHVIVGDQARLARRHIGALAGRDGNLPPSTSALDRVNNDILLKHSVVSKRTIARIEDMDVAQGHCLQERNAKRAEIRTVTEAARGNGYELTFRRKKHRYDCQKGRVEISCFDTDSP